MFPIERTFFSFLLRSIINIISIFFCTNQMWQRQHNTHIKVLIDLSYFVCCPFASTQPYAICQYGSPLSWDFINISRSESTGAKNVFYVVVRKMQSISNFLFSEYLIRRSIDKRRALLLSIQKSTCILLLLAVDYFYYLEEAIHFTPKNAARIQFH